ncbi:FAM183 family [Catenaria anguillulae PL171]|uniref:FAM183 family n=1 Tax=Catenaria anguillulae PL171 TaxID=765915 RepID=A0A1Y2HQL5_9FUNG|nr:FAM183 family [Catenaria anguillulae PL171]
MADADKAGGASTEKLNTIQKNAILEETIRKQMRRHKLHENYMLSPNIKKNLVLTAKPNTTTSQPKHEEMDPEYLKFAAKQEKNPREKYVAPQTTSQEYFWHTSQLVPENLTNPLFHHPRRSSEITKFYRAK